MNWQELWQKWLGLPSGVSWWLLAVTAILAVYGFFVLPSLVLLALVRRKFTAALQARVGPSLTGPAGSLQGVADFIKLLQKDSQSEWSRSQAFWFVLTGAALYSTLVVLPLGGAWIMVDYEMTAFVPFWLACVAAFALLMFGLEQRSVPGVFGGLRVAIQAVTAAFPSVVSVLSVGLHAGGYQWRQIVESQGASPWHWLLFKDPFQWASFLVFVCAGPLLLSFEPQTFSRATRDLAGGVSAHLSGNRLGRLKLRELYGLFFWSIMATVMFLGAWRLPAVVIDFLASTEHPSLLLFAEASLLLIKSGTLMLLIHWISSASPRVRSDQLVDFSLKVLSPISLLALIGSTLWMAGKGML